MLDLLELLTEWLYILISIGLMVALFWSIRVRVRRDAQHAREQADLHRQLGELHVELAKAEFGDEQDDLARKRLELADHHIELSENLTRHATAIADLRMLPHPRWPRRPRVTRADVTR